MTEPTTHDRLIQCQLRTGQLSETIWGLVNQLVPKTYPELIWTEPVNGPQPIRGFHGLVDGNRWNSGLSSSLLEAKLFYPEGVLHLLATASGTRYAAWYEGDSESPPEWLNGIVTADCTVRTEHLSRRERKLLVRNSLKTDGNRDSVANFENTAAARRGLGRADVSSSQLTAVEYYDRGTLRWWRLRL